MVTEKPENNIRFSDKKEPVKKRMPSEKWESEFWPQLQARTIEEVFKGKFTIATIVDHLFDIFYPDYEEITKQDVRDGIMRMFNQGKFKVKEDFTLENRFPGEDSDKIH